MATWAEVETESPELAARARDLFDSHRHKTIATLRRDGSPRISGIEAVFEDGELWLGMMKGSMKAKDVERDPRVALHSASEDPDDSDPSAWPGDAKLSGKVIASSPRRKDPPGARYRVDIEELVVTRVGDPADHLMIESWHEGRGYEKRKRV